MNQDLLSLLRRLTVDEIKTNFVVDNSAVRNLRKTALINHVVAHGLSNEDLWLLNCLLQDKDNAISRKRESRRQKETERGRRRRRERKEADLRNRMNAARAIADQADGLHDDDCDSHIGVDNEDDQQQTRTKGPRFTDWNPVSIAVHSERCPHCDAWRFVGESATFCCNGGKYMAPPLPPLPANFDPALSYRKISQESRRLNNTFAFTSIGATDGHGPGRGGFYNQVPPAYVAAHGRVYHRLFAGNHGGEHALKWYLFDEMDQQLQSGVQWQLPENVVLSTRRGLFDVNPFIREIRSLAAEATAAVASIDVRAHVAQGEVSALLCLDNTTTVTPRQVRIWPFNTEEFQYINSLSPLYEPLQYPILFPHGTLGWTPPLNVCDDEADDNSPTSHISQIWLYRGYFLREERFLRFGRLAQEYAVDMFSRVQESRLSYIYANQKRLRKEEAELMGDNYDLPDHDNIFLPASFLGGQRWCSNQTADALCLARWRGQPSFFITFTCNPKWPEITSQLPPDWHLKSCDVPSIAIRVFKLRLSRLFQDLKRVFKSPRYRVHVIEFQKRGLPHAHIAIKVVDPYVDPHEIDSVVSACLPEDASDRSLVEEFMIHKHSGPGGSVGDKDGCRTKGGTCRHHFPKPLAEKTHIDPATGRVVYKRLTEADRWVVPHNVAFLRHHNCHVNFEIAGTTSLFQYLYKYLYKGATMMMTRALTKLTAIFVHENEYLEQVRPGCDPYIIKPRPTDKVTKLSRITSLRPGHGEVFYLRVILQRRSARNWVDARTVNGVIHDTYQEAAIELGYLNETNEGYLAFEEAIQSLRTPGQLRFLFTELISDGTPALPIWNAFHAHLAQDFAQTMSLDLAMNEVLLIVAAALDERGQSLADFGLPCPTEHSREVTRELQRWSVFQDGYRVSAAARVASMNLEQRHIYDRIMTAVKNDQPLVLFMQARAGRGKTYIIDTLCQVLRAEGRIVLPTATTALAAGIYTGGRTAHSLYRVPVEENSTLLKSTVGMRSARADLLRQADLHILDEAPMANKAVTECIDDLLRSLGDADVPFGGKHIVLLGDWAQIPPVIRSGSRSAVINASLKFSPLWHCFHTMHLAAPVRNADDPVFAQWADALAENEEPREVDIPFHLISSCTERQDIVDFVFPGHVLTNPAQAIQRAILCPLKVQVAEYNNRILIALDGPERCYLSTDSIIEEDKRIDQDPMADIDHLNSMRLPGIPDHELILKVGSVCVLTRNFSVERNLTKNTKVVVDELGQRVIVVRLIRGTHLQQAENIVLPRIDFTHYFPDKGWSIKRRQFPLRLAYSNSAGPGGFPARHLARVPSDTVFQHFKSLISK
ncbi:hypothetical protein EWM64_g6940 [Hericium alpestre]|uniref:ATP-dependent DNA helicase n=1 Tax=Hericium alpestre TaxID=135208 RepID=A0A4Y9ZSQ4_9AGAM|nr:hypothetical protein EWM64_g6940 [Hericium alpestre]